MFKVPYFLEGISNIFKSVLTNEEKFEGTKGAENYRGKLIFDENACIGCGICIRVCAGEAITKEVTPVEGGQEIKMTFDLSSCTFCGLCTDFCPKSAIKTTEEIMMVTHDKEKLKVEGKFIKKINCKVDIKTKKK